VCEGCYACTGRYKIPATVACQVRRMESVQRLSDQTCFERWVKAMVLLISRENEKKSIGEENKGFFRWHDAGDLISVYHLMAIVAVARRLPDIKFWLPTKEAGIVKAYKNHPDINSKIPANLCIRISGLMVDKPAKSVKGFPVSNVHTEKPIGFACPAIEAHSGCGKLKCRKCWSTKVRAVSYKKH